MKYQAVFWDIDGTLYDNSGDIPEDEKDILSRYKKLETLPDRKLNFWVPYKGLSQLMEQIPKEGQGIISNGYHQLQLDKLFLFGLDEYVNPNLVFTSYGEAERILDTLDHPLMKDFSRQSRNVDVHRMTLETQKPRPYMFKRALEVEGFLGVNCIMIGDDWKDVKGAQSVGMKAIYIIGTDSDKYCDQIAKGRVTPDFTIEKGDIKSLSDLLI